MTDADLLRKNLPRLHAAGIAYNLRVFGVPAEMTTLNWYLGDHGCILSDSEAITYAIGAIVEAFRMNFYMVDWYAENTTLASLIASAVKFGLIPPEPTNAA